MSFTDQARAVRRGEELDAAALRRYLEEHEAAPRGDVEIEQFPGGHSNLTYLLRIGGEDYVLRRPPFGSKVAKAHDMGREVRVLSKLGPAWDKAPSPVLYCQDTSVLGCEWYLMERLRGVILRKEPPAGLTIDESLARRLSERLIDSLAELHGLDYRAIGLGDLGKPEGYVRRQIEGWTRRYGGSQTDDIAAVDEVAAWLAEHQPESGAPALIHNDFKFDNVVLDAEDLSRIVGILDWEMATVGDPLMDLGTSLCYWVESSDSPEMQMIRFGPTILPGMLTRRELVERYCEKTGRSDADVVFYYAFGLFKTAVVAQQIYYRFHAGHTKDDRFAMFIHAVRIMAEQAARAIETGTIGS